MKLAIFINGFAETGKDETVKQMTKVMEEHQFPVTAVSSIDPIRNMLRAAGYDVDNKTDEMRAFMAEVGDAAEKFDGTKTKYAVKKTVEFLMNENRRDGAVFVHVREPLMIQKMHLMLPTNEIEPVTLLVRRPGKAAVQSNKADRDVMSRKYHVIIDNDGTIEDLHAKCGLVFDRWRHKYETMVKTAAQ
jgi:hypothetical protein